MRVCRHNNSFEICEICKLSATYAVCSGDILLDVVLILFVLFLHGNRSVYLDLFPVFYSLFTGRISITVFGCKIFDNMILTSLIFILSAKFLRADTNKRC